MKRPHTIEIYRGTGWVWRWRITAQNGRIVGASNEGYERIRSCEHNLASITGVHVPYNRDNVAGETNPVPARGVNMWACVIHLDAARKLESIVLYGEGAWHF